MARRRDLDAIGYATFEVCDLTGATTRQIYYWRERGWCRASLVAGTGRSGDFLRWSEADVERVRQLVRAASLIGRGIPAVADAIGNHRTPPS